MMNEHEERARAGQDEDSTTNGTGASPEDSGQQAGANPVAEDPPGEDSANQGTSSGQGGGDDGESEQSQRFESERPRQPTYVETLERRLHEAQDQLREYIQAYKQVKEDQESFKKRLERETARDQETLRGRLVGDLVGVLDNLDRSIQGGESGGSTDDLVAGLRMVRGQFLEKLTAIGLQVVDPLGRNFDPNEAEALSVRPTGDPAEDNTVAAVFAKGYRLKDRVIRPALVQVFRYGG